MSDPKMSVMANIFSRCIEVALCMFAGTVLAVVLRWVMSVLLSYVTTGAGQ
jgi:hypothetical protein